MSATSFTDPRTNRTWQIQNGSTLVYDPGVFNQNANGQGPDPNQPNEETVVVQNVGGVLEANFNFPHNPNANVISRGNPGPMNPNNYNAATDSSVIPYLVIID